MSEETVGQVLDVLDSRKVFGRGRWKASIILDALLDGHELQSGRFLEGRIIRLHHDGFFQVKVWKIKIGGERSPEEGIETSGEHWVGMELSLSGFVQECMALTDQDLVGIISASALSKQRRKARQEEADGP